MTSSLSTVDSALISLPDFKDVSHIAGPMLIGLLLNVGMYGMLCAQTYLYYVSFQTDRPRVKGLIYLIFILETIQTVMSTKAIFAALVYGFMSVSSLDHIGSLWFSVPILGGTVAMIEQSFYAHRITILGQRFRGVGLASGLIGLLAVSQFGGSIALGIEMLQAKRVSRFIDRKVRLTVVFWNGGSALCDITIAICMTYILLSSSNKTMKDTRQRVERLVQLVLGTGTLTACIAILNLALTMLPGEPSYYETSAIVLSKLYANSILVVINSRIRFTHGYEGARDPNAHTATLMISNDLQFITSTETVD